MLRIAQTPVGLACVEEHDSSHICLEFLPDNIFEDPPIHLERLGMVNSLVFESFETPIVVLCVPVPYERWIKSSSRLESHEERRIIGWEEVEKRSEESEFIDRLNSITLSEMLPKILARCAGWSL